MKTPPLFYMKPATITGNIAGLVERFAGQGLTTRDYLKAALREPSLFT
jgi:hypothetical protein